MRAPRLVLSGNATPFRGGQGLNLQHMIDGLHRDFTLQVHCAGPVEAIAHSVVQQSPVANLIGRIPFVRRLRDWQTFLASAHFDRHVARRLTSCDVFQGVTGQCLHSLKRARKLGAKCVIDSVTAHINEFSVAQGQSCASFGVRPSTHSFQKRRTLREYAHTDLIRVMSDHAADSFVAEGVSSAKLFVAPPPFDMTLFPQSSFTSSIFRICFVGLLEPWKGFHHLIEAFEMANIPDSELVMWGGSGSRPVSHYLAAKTADNPRITIRQQEVRRVGYAQVYGQASVLVHPSYSDGFGYVVGEAMACGIPVITTPQTGASMLIKDGVSGYIVPVGDVNGITERLRHLSRNADLLCSMGAAARESVSQLTPDRFRTTMVNAIKSML